MNFMKKTRIIRLVVIAIFLFLIRLYVVQGFKTFGKSMEPTYMDGSFIFVDKLTYKVRTPRRGEVIVFRTKEKPYLYFEKRVLGLAGEKIEIKDGNLFVNDKQEVEEYLSEKNSWDVEPFVVRQGCVFVAGDNRSMPHKFHLLTQVDIKNIIGRVIGGK